MSATSSVQSITDAILAQCPALTAPHTCDTLKTGDPDQMVRGIVVTFMATYAVLQKAVELGANLIITHEPTFYNHPDETDWLKHDAVCAAKQLLIAENDLAVWRFHDAPHRMTADAIFAGMIEKLGWREVGHQIYAVEPQTARALAAHCKARLGIACVRVAGDPEAICQRVGLRVGASGGRGQIEMLRDERADVVVCGETPEWETCEYVRDAAALGVSRTLIVLGHANSEEAGMEWVATWLGTFLPREIPIHYVQAGDPFTFI